MSNDIVVIEDSLRETHLKSEDEQGGSVPQDQSSSATSKRVIRMAKKGPMHPTPLYISICFPSTMTM